jgi:hypothetical protein
MLPSFAFTVTSLHHPSLARAKTPLLENIWYPRPLNASIGRNFGLGAAMTLSRWLKPCALNYEKHKIF